MKIKAVILAGGQGSRLRPITCSRPKPLCNILGKSVIERLLQKLNNCNISDVVISALYMSDKIGDELCNNKYSFNLSIISEPEPLGSAGGARYASETISVKDTDIILILSGDGIFELNLNAVIEYHQTKKADCTIITTNRENPLEYGVILSSPDGKINVITEKPSWSEVKSNTVNTGIYVLNGNIIKHIPKDRPFDFSKDLFPHLLGINKSLYSYNLNGYWCDIGNVSEYYKCCLDALSGKISDFIIEGCMTEEEILLKKIRCNHPCYISKTANISPEAYIEKYSIIGNNVSVGGGTVIRAAIIFENCTIKKNVTLSNCIICENSVVEDGAIISQGCTIGSNVIIKESSIIDEGVSVWPGKTVRLGCCVSSDSFFKPNNVNMYSDDGYFAGKINENINISYLNLFGKAVTHTAKQELKKRELQRAPRIGIMHCGTGECSLIADTLICGIQSVGAESFSFAKGFESEAMYVASTFLLDYLLYVSCINQERIIKIFDRSSLLPTKSFEKEIELYIKNPDNTPMSYLYDTVYIDDTKQFYYSELIRKIENILSNSQKTFSFLNGVKIYLSPSGNRLSELEILFRKAANYFGAEILSEICDEAIEVNISESGLEASLCIRKKGGENLYFDTHHIIALLISNDLKNGTCSVYSSGIFYSIYEKIFNSMYDISSVSKNDIVTDNYLMKENNWIKDMCYSTIKLLCIANNQHSKIEDFFSNLPQFEIKVRNISTADVGGEKRANVMKNLYEKYGGNQNMSSTDGISIAFENGDVTVIPRRSGGFKLITNSVDAECGDEIFNEMLFQIKNIK